MKHVLFSFLFIILSIILTVAAFAIMVLIGALISEVSLWLQSNHLF